MKTLVFALCGIVFGAGLILAGMGKPSTILNAFHFGRGFDPRLYVMFVGSFLVRAPISALVRSRSASLSGVAVALAPDRLDPRLVLGSLVFGVGWGIAGLCPGPSVVAAASGAPHALVFVAGLVLALWVRSSKEK